MTEQAPAPPDGVNPVPVEHRVLGLDRRLMAPVLAVGFIARLWSVIVPFITSPAGFDNTVEPGVALPVSNGVSFTPTAGLGTRRDGRRQRGRDQAQSELARLRQLADTAETVRAPDRQE